MNSFFRELKQRNVYRVALGYGVVGWLVVQISATILPAYHAPDWILPMFITAVALGFPVALVLAWVFEVKGGVIEKAPESAGLLVAVNRRRVLMLAAGWFGHQRTCGWGLLDLASVAQSSDLLQARQTQFHFTSEFDKGVTQVYLASTQRLNGNTAEAKVTATQARSTLEPLCKNQPDNDKFAAVLSVANAENESALKEVEDAMRVLPSIKDRVDGPAREEILALVQTIIGENSRAISTLTQLLQTPYSSWIYGTSITPALLRFDPLWDPLRADLAFQKLCEEKQP